MKIKSLERAEIFYVETDEEDDNQYTRHSSNNWTVKMGESDEPVYDCRELEAAFQETFGIENATNAINTGECDPAQCPKGFSNEIRESLKSDPFQRVAYIQGKIDAMADLINARRKDGKEIDQDLSIEIIKLELEKRRVFPVWRGVATKLMLDETRALYDCEKDK